MAESTITTNGNGGKEMTASVDTIPLSLRHSDIDDALEGAAAILLFVSGAVVSEVQIGITEEAARGMSLCLELARDKVLMAKGDMEFPLIGYGNSPALCECGKQQ